MGQVAVHGKVLKRCPVGKQAYPLRPRLGGHGVGSDTEFYPELSVDVAAERSTLEMTLTVINVGDKLHWHATGTPLHTYM